MTTATKGFKSSTGFKPLTTKTTNKSAFIVATMSFIDGTNSAMIRPVLSNITDNNKTKEAKKVFTEIISHRRTNNELWQEGDVKSFMYAFCKSETELDEFYSFQMTGGVPNDRVMDMIIQNTIV